MLNHSVNAIEDIDNILPYVDAEAYPITIQGQAEVRDLLHKAIKFELPTNGVVIDRRTSLEILEPSDLRLPYPVVALEYQCTHGMILPAGVIPAKKRIALCLEYDGNEDLQVANMAQDAIGQLKEIGAIIVIPCYYSEPHGRWCVVPWAGVLPKRDIPGFDHLELPYGETLVKSKITVVSFSYLLEVCQGMRDMFGLAQTRASALYDVFEEVMAVISVLTALSCSNVVMQDHQAPPKLNKKRERAGKRALYDHKTLTVINVDRNSECGGAPDVKTGRTVRTHLRRGHVRRLPDGRRRWIQHCIVKPGPGKLDSSYRITTQGRPA